MDDKKTAQTDTIDESYELDFDQNSSNDLNEAIEEAVAAVENGTRSSNGKHREGQNNDGKINIEIDDADETLDEEAAPSAAIESDTSLELELRQKLEELEELEEENANLRERMTRTLADYDNFRKRNERERAATRSFAVSEVVGDFLGVIDNLERASTASGSVEDLKQGVEMILRLFADTLRRHQVEKIKTVGQPFDPSLHEAVAKEESPGVEFPTVTAEMQAGYVFKDRLLRPAMVNVSMPVSAPAKAEKSAAPAETGEPTTAADDDPTKDVD